MATAKSQGVTSSISSSNTATGRIKEDVPTLKNKVAELERQVADYKIKLDELRRAKATTVVKLEKEYVNTSIPGLNRPEKTKSCEKCEELEKMLDNERKSSAQLKRLIEQKENSKQQQSSSTNSGPCTKCSDFKKLLDIEKQNNQQLNEQLKLEKQHTQEERNAKEEFERALDMAQSDLIEIKSVCEALRVENQDYQKAFDAMKQEHAEKMADLCNREEEAKKQVATWEQMYREWMATMERRVNNLQVTNEELHTWLHDDNEISPQRRTGGGGGISYPLREYISSKKDDDYHQTVSSLNYSSTKINNYSENNYCNRFIYFVIFAILLFIFSILYSYYSYIDPTCFNKECTDFVCKAYSEGFIGGQLCPDLCTTKSVQLQNCLGEHKQFESRLFDDDEGNQVIRCYLKHPLSKSNPTGDLKQHFNFPEDESTLETLYIALERHIQKTIKLDNPDNLIEDLIKFADFNKDNKISLTEARSLWSLVQIDEFLYTILLSDKIYIPKIRGTCGHIYAIEKVIYPHLPFDNKQELFLSSERPNWFQRTRLAIGIIEFFSDTWHYQDTDQHLYLCQPLIKAFGYDKDYEAKMLKLNHLISSRSILSRLPNRCKDNRDCLYDSYCYASCNISTNSCQMKQFNKGSLNDLCALISSLIKPDANSTFIEDFNSLIQQCQQLINDQNIFSNNHIDLISLQIRQSLILQNLKNLLWTNIEYQMNKITKKSTKKPASSPTHSIK
ncbi:unnamed protein product [Rotaria sp. Silwood1]|nr:unnamed protein product [Rotaria sp. Silwood1]